MSTCIICHALTNILLLKVPWYPILGNHDYHGSIQAQVDRTNEPGETMWTMPATYFVEDYTMLDGGIISILYIDTCILDPGQHDTADVIYSDENWMQKQQEHLTWIEDTLIEKGRIATWLIVAGIS